MRDIKKLLEQGIADSKKIDSLKQCEISLCGNNRERSITYKISGGENIKTLYICNKCLDNYINKN